MPRRSIYESLQVLIHRAHKDNEPISEGNGSASPKKKKHKFLQPGTRRLSRYQLASKIAARNNSKNGEAESEHRANERTLAQSTNTIKTFTGVLAAIGFASAVVSGLQWWEIHSGGVDTHDLAQSAVEGQRARIVIVRSEVTTLKPEQQAFGSFHYANIGKESSAGHTFASINIYTKYEWENGKAKNDGDAFKAKCLNRSARDGIAFVIYPSTPGLESYGYTTEPGKESESGSQSIIIGQEMLDGRKIIVILGCVAYLSHEETHHVVSCAYYNGAVQAPFQGFRVDASVILPFICPYANYDK